MLATLLSLCTTRTDYSLTSGPVMTLLASAAPSFPQTVVWISRRNLEGQWGDKYNSWQLQRMFRNEGERRALAVLSPLFSPKRLRACGQAQSRFRTLDAS